MGFSINNANGNGVFTGSRKQIEEGDYIVMISKSTTAAGKKEGSQNVVMEYTITEGDFAGEVVKEWLAVVNSSEVAQQIARSKVSAISSITGITDGEVDDFQGSEIMIRVRKEPNEYVNRNGQTVKGSNAVVENYMTLQMKDAEGKDVAPFRPSSPKPTPVAQTETSAPSGGSGSFDNSDGNDDIPF